MTTPVMFNRRLGKNESDIWLQLFEKETEVVYIDRTIASHFLKHQDTVSFVSSLEDEIIGGSIIHRARTRQGMILASVSVREEFRENGAYSVIKSSLPFFRTVAIRDIEALIPDRKGVHRIGFPGSLELDYWTKEVLERIGFEEKSKLYYNIINVEELSYRPSDIPFDKTIDIEKTKSFIWDMGKSAGLMNSYIWTSLDLATNQKTLWSVSAKGNPQLIFSFYIINQMGVVSLVISEDEYFEEGWAAKALSEIVRRNKVNQLIFPLTGEGQKELVQSIADELRGSLKSRSITLMRKNL